jgi:hypothetical protein
MPENLNRKMHAIGSPFAPPLVPYGAQRKTTELPDFAD